MPSKAYTFMQSDDSVTVDAIRGVSMPGKSLNQCAITIESVKMHTHMQAQ